ncbi:unnamed protein product [Microthlaspi erraticum]|uniref:MATH domain-containing protein n=1 Tax=Microthlaspi erraticum TaxID=1685480 RepID=A0A6D2J9A1_9BRAS|nr:unnamed protein product [Microthlaspi erraticum]
MGNSKQKVTYTFEIDNFSQRNTPFMSPLFSSGFSSGFCNWHVYVQPKGNRTSKYMCLYLAVPDPHSRPHLWSRVTSFSFVVVNPSNVLSSKSFVGTYRTFNEKQPTSGFIRTGLTLSNLQEKGFLVNDKLKIEVYIYVKELHGGRDPKVLPEEKKETVYVHGFELLQSQVKSANWIFDTYPETALYIQPQDPQLKTAYMNILLRIYETLYYSPLEKLTESDLSNVSNGLLDLTQAGFKLEWLREKLEKVTLGRKKLSGYEAHALELEKQLKNLELMMSNLKAKIKLNAERKLDDI